MAGVTTKTETRRTNDPQLDGMEALYEAIGAMLKDGAKTAPEVS